MITETLPNGEKVRARSILKAPNGNEWKVTGFLELLGSKKIQMTPYPENPELQLTHNGLETKDASYFRGWTVFRF